MITTTTFDKNKRTPKMNNTKMNDIINDTDDINAIKKKARIMTCLDKERVQQAMEIIGYDLSETDWLWEALQAPGSVVKQIGDRLLLEGNRSLAAHGTKVIDLSISAMAVRSGMVAGQINDLAQKINNKRFLAAICDKAGLTDCINQNLSQKNGVPERVKANTVEAVIAAVLLDGGHGAALKVMLHLGVLPVLSA
ncbi:hypothetical protein CkaCkLH20_11297 [Colletotrichum karsti]|uniref:RNase III domain-containing protein n=1 Tax=Colletotrichum karsti TaxID=1095194 RepID=A0A9P6HUQ8_9PEZI|nr:uncharacterized protein CkaCkLH20_11297 [Colletotrichum karsti]KAF9871128.1 hypothetical protein CkaCkLH20_11297 [Colletotrichum karsti]